MANKVYTIALTGQIAGGVVVPNTAMFDIDRPNRQLKIKSITWDYRFFDQTAGATDKRIMPENNIDQWIKLNVGGFAAPAIGEEFTNYNGTLTLDNTGSNVQIFRPCHLIYDSFIAFHKIKCSVTWSNFHATHTFIMECQLTIEVDEIVIYQ